MEALSARTLHVVIDMQRLFAEDTAWHTPQLPAIVPAVRRLAAARPDHTVFACFEVPSPPEAATGRWVRYYRRWRSVTGQQLAPGLLEPVPALADLAPAERRIGKATYSVFGAPDFAALLDRRGIDTLVLSGVETDVCVLASLFDAVDRGLHVVVPADAVTSSSPDAHRAVLDHVLPRLAEQVTVTTVDAVLRAWSPG